MKNPALSTSLTFILLGVSLISSVAASPKTTTPSRHWQLEAGDNTAEASPEGIHVTQRIPVNTSQYANATAKLIVANSAAWRVGFDVRFGTLRPSGAVVRLYKGNDSIGWVGADVWSKNMGICTGENNFKFAGKADSEWHHIEYICDGSMLSVYHNGQKTGEDVMRGAPDRIFVGSTSPGKTTPAQQTEIWLRDVQEEDISTTIDPVVAPVPFISNVTTSDAKASEHRRKKLVELANKDSSYATLINTLVGLTKTISKYGGMHNRDGTVFDSYRNCSCNVLHYSIKYDRQIPYDSSEDHPQIEQILTTEIPLSLMDNSQVTVRKYINHRTIDCWNVFIDAPNHDDIIYELTQIPERPAQSHEVMTYSTNISFEDEDTANRFAIALRLAIRLSANRKPIKPF